MLESLLLLTISGVVLGSRPCLGFGNPFQIYFLVWSLVFIGYYAIKETFIPVSTDYYVLIFTAKALAMLILGVVFLKTNKTKTNNNLKIVKINKELLFIAQVIVAVGLLFVFFRANSLSGGGVFTVSGYVRLRTSLTHFGEGYGVLGYLLIISFVVTSLMAFLYAQKKVSFLMLFFSSSVSLFYAYFSTGRTSFLLFFCLVFFPLVLIKFIDKKKFILSSIGLVFSFLFIAAMTSKGVSLKADFSANVSSVINSFIGYSLAPFVAFYNLTEIFNGHDFGSNTFRFFYALAHSLGLTSDEPVSLIREFSYVPQAVNVYTVYEVYFKDFRYVGVFIPPLFLIGHYLLYSISQSRGGVFIFYYSASVYPLVMQFFQDQYFSLMSQWIQIIIWFFLFTIRVNLKLNINKF